MARHGSSPQARDGRSRRPSQGKKKPTGKRIGKSKPAKANNQLNRRVK